MTTHQSDAPTIFTHAQLWDQYGLSDDYGERVQLMTQLLPPQAASVLSEHSAILLLKPPQRGRMVFPDNTVPVTFTATSIS